MNPGLLEMSPWVAGLGWGKTVSPAEGHAHKCKEYGQQAGEARSHHTAEKL